MQVIHLLAIFIGGGVGSVTRYIVSRQMLFLFGASFPVGTLAVNALGSFLIGVIASLIANKPQHDLFQFLLITGFLGGFTTFSAFSLETWKLISAGQFEAGLLNIFLNVLLSIFFVFLGILTLKLF